MADLYAVLKEINTSVSFISKRGPILYEKLKGRRGYRMREAPGGANRVIQYMADKLRNHAWGKKSAYDLKWVCKREDKYTVSMLDLPESEEVPDEDKYTLIRLDPNKLNYDNFSQCQWEVRHNIKDDSVFIVPIKIEVQDIIDAESAIEYVARSVLNEQEWQQPMPVIFSHDYHNSTLNDVINRLLEGSTERNAFFAHFEHTPLPSAKNFRLFDEVERYDERKQSKVLLEASLINDDYFLQSNADVQRYLDTVRTYLPDASIRHENVNGIEVDIVSYKDHDTWVRAVPVSVDPKGLRKRANKKRVRNEAARARTDLDEDTLVIYSTDRGGEETKAVAKKLRACNEFKRRHPDARVVVNQQYDPSRMQFERYKAELERIEKEAEKGNSEFPGFITLDPNKYEQDRLLHRYAAYDILLVTPLSDGYNLVSTEGGSLATTGSITTLILSENAGAAERLGNAGAILVNPEDEESIIKALEYAVFEMTTEERLNKAKSLRRIIDKEDMENYTYKIFETIAESRARKLKKT